MREPVGSETARRGIACAGNWILDTVYTISDWPEKSGLALIRSQHVGLGGGPANVALDLKEMGAPYPIVPIGLIGAGETGDTLLRLCTEAGLPTHGLRRTTRAETSQTHVMNVRGDSRTFFYLPGANGLFNAASIDLGALSRAGIKLFYLGYLTLLDKLEEILPDGRTRAALVLSQARAGGMKTCVDLASLKSDTFANIVNRTLPEIDYLFANEIEAEAATGIAMADGSDSASMLDAACALKSGGVRQAVILHSPTRIVCCENDGEFVLTPEPIPAGEIISPVGAGDAFCAGVLHGIHEDWPLESCLKFGMHAAAACLSGYTASDGLKSLTVPAVAP